MTLVLVGDPQRFTERIPPFRVVRVHAEVLIKNGIVHAIGYYSMALSILSSHNGVVIRKRNGWENILNILSSNAFLNDGIEVFCIGPIHVEIIPSKTVERN